MAAPGIRFGCRARARRKQLAGPVAKRVVDKGAVCSSVARSLARREVETYSEIDDGCVARAAGGAPLGGARPRR
jgi:hypothetical protein